MPASLASRCQKHCQVSTAIWLEGRSARSRRHIPMCSSPHSAQLSVWNSWSPQCNCQLQTGSQPQVCKTKPMSRQATWCHSHVGHGLCCLDCLGCPPWLLAILDKNISKRLGKNLCRASTSKACWTLWRFDRSWLSVPSETLKSVSCEFISCPCSKPARADSQLWIRDRTKATSTQAITHMEYTLSYLPGALEIAFQTLEPGSF